MGLLDNIQNFGQRVRTASQPFLDVYNTPEFQQQITLGTSLLSGAGVPASIQAANQAGLLAQNTQNIRRQREGIEALKKRFANNPNILSLLNTNPTGVINALTTQAFAPTVDTSTSLMKNIAFLKEQFPDKSIAELIAMTKQPANVVNVNQGTGELNKKVIQEIAKDIPRLPDVKLDIEDLKLQRDRLKEDSTLTGGVRGAISVLGDYQSLVDPKAADVKERIQSVVQKSIRSLMGAQFTEREGQGILKRAFNPLLKTEQNIERINLLITKLQAGYDQKVAIINAIEKGDKSVLDLQNLQSKLENDFANIFSDTPTTVEISEQDKTALRSKRPASISEEDFERMLNFLSKAEVERAIELSK
tara:strand:- start:1371 stop:2453 length:1083 start_codon:yes stop_codon:yes gene_type:complete